MSDSAQPASMSSEQMIEACLKHTMYSWAATGKVAPLPIARAEGVYMWTPDGKRILDFNSQLMSVNVGHSHPKMVEAIKRAAEGLIYVFPGTATQARAELSTRLAELMPGDLNCFFFTLGGAEANENAIRMARLKTGRFKIPIDDKRFVAVLDQHYSHIGQGHRAPNPAFV